MNDEPKQLENEGIIEDITGEPTSWLNLLVIVPKGEHSIRICVDMHAANKAIMRTRYLKGSKILTKLDMTSALHQIELDQDCQFITACQLDTCIKRFKKQFAKTI